MIELIQITNDPGLARRCDALDGMRLFVDLERLGKAKRQTGRNTFISSHEVADVAAMKSQLRRSRLMVRVNPLNEATAAEIEAVLKAGADLMMLPMFHGAAELREFCGLVDGRAPVTALLETGGALDSLAEWIGTPGLGEIFVGLNDLHLALERSFMFELLAEGVVDRVAAAARAAGKHFGFGGIAALDSGLLPGRDVLAEHLRLGSGAVILSRSFHSDDRAGGVEEKVAALRAAESELEKRSPDDAEADRLRIAAAIRRIVAASAAA